MLFEYSWSCFISQVKIFGYLVSYNLGVAVLLFMFFTESVADKKTLNTFSTNRYDYFNILIGTIALLSLAGVPPLLGFFMKLFLLMLISHDSLFLLYPLFLILLLTGLYFYVQNIRYIHSLKPIHTDKLSSISGMVVTYKKYEYTLLATILMVLGVVFMDDLLIIITWLLL